MGGWGRVGVGEGGWLKSEAGSEREEPGGGGCEESGGWRVCRAPPFRAGGHRAAPREALRPPAARRRAAAHLRFGCVLLQLVEGAGAEGVGAHLRGGRGRRAGGRGVG